MGKHRFGYILECIPSSYKNMSGDPFWCWVKSQALFDITL